VRIGPSDEPEPFAEREHRGHERNDREPNEQHAHEADGAELAEAAEVRDRERPVRDAPHRRAHELGPKSVAHGDAARFVRRLTARTKLAVAGDEHDGIVDAVAEDDGAEERARRVDVPERRRGEGIGAPHAEQRGQRDDDERPRRAKEEHDPGAHQQENGTRGEERVAHERLFFSDGVRNVAGVPDDHPCFMVTRVQILDVALHPREERVTCLIARSARRRHDAEGDAGAVFGLEVPVARVVETSRGALPALLQIG
jgi:hypothetical protein